MTDHIRQTIEEAGIEENTSLLGGDVGTRKQEGQCCSEVQVNWTHRKKEARPYEETQPEETFPQC